MAFRLGSSVSSTKRNVTGHKHSMRREKPCTPKILSSIKINSYSSQPDLSNRTLPQEAYESKDFLDWDQLEKEVISLTVKKTADLLKTGAEADVSQASVFMEAITEQHPEISLFSIAEALGKVKSGEDPVLIADSLLKKHGEVERPEVKPQIEYNKVSPKESKEINKGLVSRMRHLRTDSDISAYRRGFVELTHRELFEKSTPKSILPASFPVEREIDSLYGSSSAVIPDEQYYLDLDKDRESKWRYKIPYDMVPEPLIPSLKTFYEIQEKYISSSIIERDEEEIRDDQYEKDVRGEVITSILERDPYFNGIDMSRAGGRLMGSRREETMRLYNELEELEQKQRQLWNKIFEEVHQEIEERKLQIDSESKSEEMLNFAQTQFNTFKQSIEKLDQIEESVKTLYQRVFINLDKSVTLEEIDTIDRLASQVPSTYYTYKSTSLHYAILELIRERVLDELERMGKDPKHLDFLDVEEADEFDFTRPPTFEELKATWRYFNYQIRIGNSEDFTFTDDAAANLFNLTKMNELLIDPELVDEDIIKKAAQWIIKESEEYGDELLGRSLYYGAEEGTESIKWTVEINNDFPNANQLLELFLKEDTKPNETPQHILDSLYHFLSQSEAAKEAELTQIEGEDNLRFVERSIRRIKINDLKSTESRRQVVDEIGNNPDTPVAVRRFLADLVYADIVGLPPAQRRGPLAGLRHDYEAVVKEIDELHEMYIGIEQALVNRNDGEAAAELLQKEEFAMNLDVVLRKYLKHMMKNEEDAFYEIGVTLSPLISAHPSLPLKTAFGGESVPDMVMNVMGSIVLEQVLGHPGRYFYEDRYFAPGVVDSRGIFHSGMYDSENDRFLGGSFRFDLDQSTFLPSNDLWGFPESTTVTGKRIAGHNMNRLGTPSSSLLKRVDWNVGVEGSRTYIETDDTKEEEEEEDEDFDASGEWKPRETKKKIKVLVDRVGFFRGKYEEYDYHDDPIVGAENEYAHLHMPTHNPHEFMPAYLGRFYIMTTPDYHSYFREGLPGNLETVFSSLKQRALMLRKPVMDTVQKLRRFHRTVQHAIEGKDTQGMYNPRGFMFVGDRGTGKSTSLTMCMHWARKAGYMVVHVRSAYAWTHGFEGIVHPSPVLKGYYDNPILSMQFLKDFRSSNKEFIENRPIQVKLNMSPDDPNVKTLLDLVNWGINDPTATTIVTKFLLDELALIKDIPMAIAVDDYNFFNDITYYSYGNLLKFEEEEPKQIHANELTFVRGLNKILLENKPNTLWLTAVTSKHRTPNNWNNKETVFERVNHSNYTLEELTNIFTYYISVYHLNTFSTAKNVKDMHFMTAGNPEKVYDELCMTPKPSDLDPIFNPMRGVILK